MNLARDCVNNPVSQCNFALKMPAACACRLDKKTNAEVAIKVIDLEDV
jgi:hypothetical protein